MDHQDIFDHLSAPKVPEDIGCLVTAIAEEYKYFYHEVLNPTKFGFKSWHDLVNTIPELSIKPLKAHRVIVSEPLGRQAATELLASAFMQGQSSANSIKLDLLKNEVSTQTESLPPILIAKNEDPVLKVEVPDNLDLYVCNQDDRICNNKDSIQESTTNTTSVEVVNSVQKSAANTATKESETCKNKKNLSTSHSKQSPAPYISPSSELIKNLTPGSGAQKHAESNSILTYLSRTKAVVEADSSREKNGRYSKKRENDDHQEPNATDKSESPVKSVSRPKRARNKWILEAEDPPANVETESSPPVIYIGSKRLKPSTDDGCSSDEDVGSRGGRSRKTSGTTGKRKQTARKKNRN